MMVLRHVGPPTTTVAAAANDMGADEERPPIPMDLSNKHPLGSHDISRHLPTAPLLSILPPTAVRPLSSPRKRCVSPPFPHSNNNKLSRCNTSDESQCEGTRGRSKSDLWRLRKREHKETESVGGWRDGRTEEETTCHSSPDSGLHRDSPAEEEDVGPAGTPPLRSKGQSLIPLSIIRARYSHSPRGEETDSPCSPKGSRSSDHEHVLSKRARLEEMVSHIKTSKDRSRRNSGDDDTSSGEPATSGDEVADEGPADLRRLNFSNGTSAVDQQASPQTAAEDEPCNLVCAQSRLRNGREEDRQNNSWRGVSLDDPVNTKPTLVSQPSDAAKLLALDPDSYQQQLLQLQLTSAAMLGDPGGLLKGLGPYPPWIYLNYYSQLLHSFQAQEILRQYAMQSNTLTPSHTQEDKSPPSGKIATPSRYNCQSPLSPASLSEGPAGMDSDGSTVGQAVGGMNSNARRAPRAMTGRHVRTGTGASPSTLQTLRQKIEERQRIKAQQARSDLLHQSNTRVKSGKYFKKSSKK